MVTVVWREWLDDTAVAQLTKMGTLPQYETELDLSWVSDGDDVARMIAEEVNSEDCEWFSKNCEILILEPPQFSGCYSISVDYTPSFFAARSLRHPGPSA
jgi:hypothetical protein